MLVKNEKMMEKYGIQRDDEGHVINRPEDQTIFLVSPNPQRGKRVADNVQEKDWEWATGKSVVVRDSIEGFINEEDALKYKDYLSYLPYPFFILEAIGRAEDLVAASSGSFGKHSAIQLGYSQVDVKRVIGPKS